MINLENKKQILVIGLAVALGLIAVAMTSRYLDESIRRNNSLLAKQLTQEYEKRLAEQQKMIAQDMMELQRAMQSELQQVIKQQQAQQERVQRQQAEKKPQVQAKAFSVNTPPGKRAVTVMIDPLSAVGGLISPGDYVDVIAQMNMPDSSGREGKAEENSVTTVLFQNVRVLAVDTNYEETPSAPVYQIQQKAKQLFITLALSPEEAGLLTFAQKQGKLQFALRPPASREMPSLQAASWDTLADYLLEQQGTELILPQKQADIRSLGSEEVKPMIQIFKGGQEQRK